MLDYGNAFGDDGGIAGELFVFQCNALKRKRGSLSEGGGFVGKGLPREWRKPSCLGM